MAMTKTGKVRVAFGVWGRGATKLGIGPGSVLARKGDDLPDLVCRRIERQTGLKVLVCRGDGWDPQAGQQHYHVTLGTPLPRRTGGGFDVKGEFWFSIPGQGIPPAGGRRF